MAEKLQRNSLGKLLRNVAGKIIRSVRCCCGQPPTPGCNVINDDACEEGASASITIQVDVAGVTERGGCDVDLGFNNIAGTVNRSYIIRLSQGESPSTPPPTNLWTGYFLAALRTGAANAIDYQVGCPPFTLRRGWYGVGVSFGLNEDDDQIALAAVYPLNLPVGNWTWFWNAQTSGEVVTDFCSTPNTIDNANDSPTVENPVLGTGGTVTITPCPPCIVECDGPPCAYLTTSVECGSADPTANCIGPEPYLQFRGRMAAGDFATHILAPPAGCVWVYTNWHYTSSRPAADRRSLYIWNDGQDWQAMLTTGLGQFEGELARTKFAGEIECGEDDFLAGTITLEYITEDGRFRPSGDYCYAEDCTVTVTLGPCPGDCDEVDANYLSQDVAWFNGGASYAAGDYEIEYLYGAITYDQINQGYRVNAISGGYYYAIVGDDETDIAEAPPQGEYAEYPNEAAHTADHQGSTVTFTHSGGKIGIRLHDDNTTDNALDAAHRPPRFRLCAVPA